MDRNAILTLYDYNYWANRRILDAVEQVAAEDLHRDVGLSWGTVFNTLAHALSAEWAWRLRIGEGVSPSGLLDPAEFDSLAALRTRWASEETAMRAFLDGVTDADLAAPVHYHNTRGDAFATPLWQILIHVVNHGTQHRAEVAHFATQFGHSPGDIDFSVYFRQLG